MGTITFRFYGDLNDFLPAATRGRDLERPESAGGSVKDGIEAFGVPHVEVDLVVINGEPRDFAALLAPGDRVAVLPDLGALAGAPGTRLLPAIDHPPRFVLDIHLGKLAAGLRLLGFDTLYRNDWPDEDLARVSAGEHRLLLTRDIGLLKRKQVWHGAWVRSTSPPEQVREILRRFRLEDQVQPFTRCMRCNGFLEDRRKEEVAERVPFRSREAFQEFYQCIGCGRVYWQGSHFAGLLRRVEELTRTPRGPFFDREV
ncbi:MAG: Mut7-C ubiquitin/RNAse domain-containing protein [Acidobacteria bacterium]|nr:Mut7-C ubiquitin/RNAse domain-containing protein [Acidobacteriota bacterium]